jgi:hypothetical protein
MRPLKDKYNRGRSVHRSHRDRGVLVLFLCIASACKAPATTTRRPGIAVLDTKDAVRVLTPGDLGRTFETTDEAAVAVCNWLWQNEPNAKHWEFCGVIFRDAQGLKAGLPVTGRRSGRCTLPFEPENATTEGTYHSHLATNEFSVIDLQTSWKVAHYLCAPDGTVLKYQVGRGTERVK